jgi:hypothetical protein
MVISTSASRNGSVRRAAFRVQLFVLPLASALAAGCSDNSGGNLANAENAYAAALSSELASAHYCLSTGDLEKFQLGRARKAILEDLHWRAGSVDMASCEGRTVCAITYELLPTDRKHQQDAWVHAVFVDNQFYAFRGLRLPASWGCLC